MKLLLPIKQLTDRPYLSFTGESPRLNVTG